MKKPLLSFLIFVGFILSVNKIFAATTKPTYASNTYNTGATISLVPTYSNGNPTLVAVTTGTLPTGLTIATTGANVGTISGSVATAGTYGPFKVTATNASGTSASANFYIYIAVPPSFSYSPSNPYTASISVISLPANVASGGPLTSATTSPALPPGLSISSSGTISGTPTTASSATYTVTGKNSAGGSGTASVTITVVNPPAPTLSYNPASYTFTLGTSIGTISPASTNVGGLVFGAGTSLPTPTNPTGFANPENIGKDASGNIYVCDTFNGVIREYSSAGAFIGNFGSGYPTTVEPQGIVFDSSGNAYVLDEFNGGIYKLVNGVVSGSEIYPNGGFPSGYAIAIDPSNNIYVSDEFGPYIAEYSTTTNAYVTNFVGPITQPMGIAVDASGNLYEEDGNGSIYKFTSPIAATAIISGLTTPVGLTIDGSGNIYVGDSGTTSVKVYSSSGATLLTTVSGITNPYGLLVDNIGNLYVADYTNATLKKYSPASGYTLNTSLPPGLTFSTTTGKFSGTPTTAFSNLVFTVTATNATTSVTFNVTFSSVSKPLLTYATPNIYALNANFTLTPTNTGGVATSCTISPALPTGVTISATGVISGSSSVASSVTYTVTATNAIGSASSNSFVISFITAPSISYTTPNNYATGTPISPLSPTVAASGPVTSGTTYSSAITLAGGTVSTPHNLGIDPTTGDVYVTNSTGSINVWGPTGTFIRNVTTTGISPVGIVFDALGNAYLLDATSKKVIKYTGNSPGNLNGTAVAITGAFYNPYGIAIDGSGYFYVADYNVNTYGDVYKYTGSGTTYSLALTLSNGPLNKVTDVAVDGSGNIYVTSVGNSYKYVVEYSSTGTVINSTLISGAYTSIYVDGGGNIYLTSAVNNTVTVYNSSLVLQATLSVTSPQGVVVDSNGDIFVSSTATTNAVFEFVPTSGFHLSGPPPPGLSFSNTTGTFSGTPTAPFTGTYTVTAYNSVGPGTSNTFVINCYPAPVITYTTPDAFADGTTITSLSPTNTGAAAVSYSISPNLPTGLSISGTTGVISGQPSTVTPPTNYTVTATSSTNTSGYFTISITTYAPLSISYNPPANAYPQNALITPLQPTVVGGPIYPLYVNATPPVPAPTLVANITNPWGLAVDASGDVYAAGYGGNTVSEYNTSGTQTVLINPTPYSPTGEVVDAAGNIYVLFSNGSVYRYNSSGTGGTLLTSINSTSYGIAIDGAGNLYITDWGGSNIYKYTAATGILSILVAYPGNKTTIYDPFGIAVDGAGNVYIVDNYSKKLLKYSSTGSYVSTILSGLNAPYGLFIDPTGNFYIADAGAGTVKEYNSFGTLNPVNQITTGLTAPQGVAVDKFGNLYVSDYSANKLLKYPPSYYVLSGGTLPLPAGLSFNTTTGTFTGTPTTVFGPTTYTVTTYGETYSATTPGNAYAAATTTVTLSCYTSYDWTGTTSTDWNTAGNWKSLTVPGASNTANIGVNFPFTNQPTVATAGQSPYVTSVAAVTFGNKGGSPAPVLTVTNPYTLSVSGAITKQSDANSQPGSIATLAGTGIITAGNLNILANTSTAAATYKETLASAISSLQLSGNIALTSTYGTYAANAAFNVTGGITTLSGTGSNGIITTSNQSGSTSTLSMTGGLLQLSNAAPLSGLSSTGTNTLALTGGAIDYHGAAQTVYTDYPVTGLSAGVSYYGIKFSGTGIKTLNGGITNNLNIAGNYIDSLANNASNYVLLKNTIVNFNGTAAQALAGGPASIAYGSIFNTVNFSNAGTKTMSGAFYVASTGTLNLSNSATLVAGDNIAPTPTAADAYLTLISDVNGAATVPVIPSGCAINGNVNVQRYITGGNANYRGYRLLSSPVNAGSGVSTLNYVKNNVYLTGTTGTGGGFDGGASPTLYLFRDNLAGTNVSFTSGNFRGVNNITTTPSYGIDGDGSGFQIPQGNGFMMFYRGSRNTASYAAETTTSYVPTADTVMATGFLNQGQIVVKDWFNSSSTNLDFSTVSGSVNIDGYNLVGNPYASSIDWDKSDSTSSSAGIYAPKVTGFIYLLDSKSKNYNVYQRGMNGAGTLAASGSNIIPSGQGFFVVAYSTAAQLVFNESAKTNTQATAATGNLFLALQQPSNQAISQYMRLILIKDTLSRDGIIFHFSESSKTGYDFKEDAPYKTGHGSVSLASRSSDGISLAINSTPYPQKAMAIPLEISAATSGTYTFDMTDFKNIPDMFDVWLKDAHMKDSLDIKHNPKYAFDVNTGDTSSYGNKRFSLIIRQNPSLALHLINFTASKATGTIQTAWTVENEANYTKFNLLKSTDGIAFSPIDSLLSSSKGTYSFTDVNPKSQNYYKLQLIDLTGNITYSSIVPVIYSNTNKPVNGLTVYPNPTNNMINIAVNQGTIATSGLQNQTVTTTAPATGQSYDIKITNMTGEILKTVTAVSATWQNNVSSLLPGTYIIQVFTHGSSSVVGRTTFVKL